jgi:type II secretory pathway pseudopilin PulG
MAVVTIIGMMAVAIMPGITDMVASTRQHSAADEIMLLARRARREALLGGKYAYSLVFQEAAGNGTGAVQVATGITGYCNRSSGINYGNDPWTGVLLPFGWQSALGSVVIGTLSFGSHRIFGVMEMPENQVHTRLTLCYAANGETHVVTAGIDGEQTQPAVLHVRRAVNNVQAGVSRQIVFLPGGTARMR